MILIIISLSACLVFRWSSLLYMIRNTVSQRGVLSSFKGNSLEMYQHLFLLILIVVWVRLKWCPRCREPSLIDPLPQYDVKSSTSQYKEVSLWILSEEIWIQTKSAGATQLKNILTITFILTLISFMCQQNKEKSTAIPTNGNVRLPLIDLILNTVLDFNFWLMRKYST